MLSVVTNLATLAMTHQLQRTDTATTASLRRLSSGSRLSSAAEDAAGLTISEGLRAQQQGMAVAVRNTQDGISVLQIADGSLARSQDLLHRMRDLAVEAANQGALTASATGVIQEEIDQLKGQLDAIASTTGFDGTRLLDGTFARVFQVGANAGQTIAVTIGAPGRGMGTSGLGLASVDVAGQVAIPSTSTSAVSAAQGATAAGTLTLSGDYATAGSYQNAYRGLVGSISYNGKSFDLASVDYSGAVTAAQYQAALNNAANAALGTTGSPFTGSAAGLVFTGQTPGAGSTLADAVALSPVYSPQSGASAAIPLIDQAIDQVSSLRAYLGAVTNQFQQTVDRLDGAMADTAASGSRIRDSDMASEMTTFSREQILTQAGTAMLSQGDQSQAILRKLLS